MKRTKKEKRPILLAQSNETKQSLFARTAERMSRFFADEKIIRTLSRLAAALIIFCLIILLLSFACLAYQKLYANKFYSGLKLAGVSLGGKTLAQARREITAKIDVFSRQGLTVIYQNKTVAIPAAVIGPNPDSSFDLFSFRAEEILQALFQTGRSDDALADLKEQTRIFIFSPNQPLLYYLNEERMAVILTDNFSSLENKAEDAAIVFKDNNISVRQEKYGKTFNYREIIAQIKRRVINNNLMDCGIANNIIFGQFYRGYSENRRNQEKPNTYNKN